MSYRFALYCVLSYIYLPYTKCQIRNKRGKNDFSGWIYYILHIRPMRPFKIFQCVHVHTTPLNSVSVSLSQLSHIHTTIYFEMGNKELLRFNSIKIIKRITEFCEDFISHLAFHSWHWITWYSCHFHFHFDSFVVHVILVENHPSSLHPSIHPSIFIWISIHLTQK